MRVAVLADTHLAPGSARRLPDRAYDELAAADVVLHGGDIVAPEALRELRGLAPVVAVLGNNDRALAGSLPERVDLRLAGLPVAMIHDSGPRAGRARRLHRWFPDAAVVVFGHSHLPVDEEGEHGQRLFNPGSATWKRLAPARTMGRWLVDSGTLVSAELVDLDAP
ncbi:MAG: metallophosphoesterase family protein [Actinobacteria bacterium]|nr:metallophosphoesterase family protein [Actinomycetota bacterium]